MRAGEDPCCLVDFWMQNTLEEGPEIMDLEVGGHLFDFLFAAQDASTSSLLWAVALLDSHPEVLRRVRAEVSALWSPEYGEPISTEKLREMKYTEAVVREVLRYRPPATMGFPDPERFEPDRFLEERQEDRLYKRHFLAFGAGPHQCVGQRYAVNHLVIFVALFVSLLDFRRHRTDGCDEIAYVPTIVPKDDCTVLLSKRCEEKPSSSLGRRRDFEQRRALAKGR
ncbi:hypothetical protein HPP92_004055 [Vanilla planifolia]|uniref:C-22 sterol desaturase n=1 Tax=Vanilla planifolia TaxID=51239 RepID=A0A835S142_VANPL|nr:hypothetical protein HPP92_004055 [Vanilla planifolia]